jgi:hypothetical protein
MPRVYAADSTATPEAAWALLARPDRWHEWAPHVRGAWGLGDPEVEPGRVGAARLLGAVPVPAQIVHKRDGRSWTWRVGPVVMVHAVTPKGGDGGCRVSVTITAPWPLETVLTTTYGPLVKLLVERLARVAATSSSTGTSAAG